MRCVPATRPDPSTIARDDIFAAIVGLALALSLFVSAANAQTLIANDNQFALLDPLANEARILDARGKVVERYKTGETPIDAVFVGRELYVLERDARTLSIAGTNRHVDVADDPAFVRESNGRLYVYSRGTGVVEEITRDLRIVRRVTVAPFASDFEIVGRTGYLVFPEEGKMRTLSIATMKTIGEIAVGAVPVGVASAGGNMLAIADPSAKRVWLIEGEQTFTQAVARGFLRGLLGLGLSPNRQSEFPTGVDRVLTRGSLWIAYDSASGTLYRFTKSRVVVLARKVAPGSFALTEEGLLLWDGTALRLQKNTAGKP
jgi:hypothetical protein